MKKLPCLYFYCGDLWKDNDFKSCGWQAQNLWLRMLLLLHDNVPRGEFRRETGEPMPDEQIAKLCEMPMTSFIVLAAELEGNHVFSRIAGAIANRRMLRESQVHELKAKAGKAGAHARWQKDDKPMAGGNATPMASEPTYSSSSSSSSSVSRKNKSESNVHASQIPDHEWIENLKLNHAYQHIDFPVELGKMDAWLSLAKNKHRLKTRQFILNWLNKIEKPLSPEPKKRILYT